MRTSPFVSALAGLIALVLSAATVAVAHATPARASGCKQVDALKSVFPGAGAVGFDTRLRVDPESGKRWHVEGMCGGWWTTYADSPYLAIAPFRAFTQVSVHLFKTRGDALAYFVTPAFGPIRTLPNGVRIRTSVYKPVRDGVVEHEEGQIVSVVRNVIILSGGQSKPPDYRGSEAVRAQLRIHRRIQAAVLALG